MSFFNRLRSIVVMLFLGLVPAALLAQDADTIYVNGNVYTVDDTFSTASAFAIKDGSFIYVGNDAGARERAGPNTTVINLDGKTVIPGLHDAHIHIRFGEREMYPRIPDIRESIGEWATVEQMQAAVKRALETGIGMRPGPEPRWIVLRGWMSDVWEPPVWRKELIDAVAPDNPVHIIRYTHGSAANSKALELAGIDRNTPDPEGGHIKKDETGEPTGEFVERAPPQMLNLIPDLPPMTNYELSRNLVEGTQLALAAGITTLHGASSSTSYADVLRQLKLYETDLLRVRINQMVSVDAAMEMGAPLIYENKFYVQSVKTLLDGALGSRGAHFLEEYQDYPGFHGEPRSSEDATTRIAIDLLEIGFNMRIHTIGDAANRIALNAFEAALKQTGKNGRDVRFALEHAQVITPEDIPRLRDLGVIASMQPLHATEDMHFAAARLGDERLTGAYAWRTLLDNDIVVAFGTDYSVSPYNPFYTLHAAVTRQDRENNPAGGWRPEEAVTREEALYASTMAGAYAMRAEDVLGSIEIGKLADFLVIPVDYMTIPAEDIWKIEPDMTVVGGDVVYRKTANGD